MDLSLLVLPYPRAVRRPGGVDKLGILFGRIKDGVVPGDALPEGGGQSRPVEKFDEKRKVAFADGFFQIPEGRTLLDLQIARMTDDEVEIAGLVRRAGEPAAVGPDFFLRKESRNEAAQLFQMPGLKGENRVSHVSDAAFRKA